MNHIRDLHRSAFPRLGGRTHAVLHDMAADLGRSSLKDCTPADIAKLQARVSVLPLLRGGEQGIRGSQSQRTKRVAPRGKKRPEGVIPLASGRQKGLIHSLLEKLLRQPNENLRGVEFVLRRIMGQEWIDGVPAEHRHARGYADAAQTGPDAQNLIRGLVGELKRRGLWV